MIFGGSGRDFIIGGIGSDTIWGGAGDDVLYGGDDDRVDSVRDVFAFAPNHGWDDVMDFDTGRDVIDLSEMNLNKTYSQMVASNAVFTAGGDTYIVTGPSSHILLAGVDLSDLSASNFII